MTRRIVLLMALLGVLAGGCQPNESLESTMTTFAHTNRLATEKSPYLLQHAHNPVDWYPWGDEAFAKAAKEDKPIFLSIGYSTCHWCHVMEHESFEDEAVAKLLNELFVCIKVDREERPDIDQIYMKVCMMMTGQGGWPLTIVMTPDKQPFFAGTYFPKEGRFGRGGMMQLLPAIADAWRDERKEVLASVNRITNALVKTENLSGALLNESILKEAYDHFHGTFDSANGGFGTKPKFPSPHNLSFLLGYGKRSGTTQAVAMVESTLQAMRNGGVYDHVGFGFHRYSTDPYWKLPHFEKMLYDQAMMTLACVDAYRATGNASYKTTACDVISYVLRDLKGKEGAFYSAEDADSEGEEGKFYVWTQSELGKILTPDEARAVITYYAVTPTGNFTDEATGHSSPANILHVQKSRKAVADLLSLSQPALDATLESARLKLLAIRSKRIRPHLDDKILADWNGLMIAAMARASAACGNEEYRTSAATAADFVMSTMRDKQGRLLHRYRDGHTAVSGMLDDYAFMIMGLLELYEAGYDPRHLQQAVDLTEHMIRHFWDHENGAFYFTADDAEKLITREKETYDGAVPSGNSVALNDLLRLGALTGRAEYLKLADQLSMALSGRVASIPAGHCQFLMGVGYALGPSFELVIVGKKGSPDLVTMLGALQSRYLPNVTVHVLTDETRDAIAKLAPFTQGHTMKDGKATAYVCKQWSCQLPTTDPEKMLQLLGEK